MNNKAKAVVKNDYVVSVICKILGVAVTILYSSLSARYLGAGIKGEVAYITGIVNVSSIILTVGVHQAYPYYKKNDTTGDIKNYFMNTVLFMTAVYYAVCVVLCFFSGGDIGFILCVLLSPLFAYKRISSYVYLVEAASRRNVIMLVVHIFQLIYVAVLNLTTKSNLLLGISPLIVVDIILSVIYTRKINFKLSFKYLKLGFLKKLIAYGIIPMISLLLSTLNYRLDILMLHEFENVAIASVGVYSIGVALAEEVLLIPEAVKEVLLSRLSSGAKEEEVARVMRLCLPICLLMFVGIALLGQPFINLLYGAEFTNAYPVTVITMFGVTAIMFYKMITTYNIVNKKQTFNLVILISSVAINFVANWILIPIWDIMGAAIATVISYLYCAVVFLSYFSRRSNIRIRDMVFLKREDIKSVEGLFDKKRTQNQKAGEL